MEVVLSKYALNLKEFIFPGRELVPAETGDLSLEFSEGPSIEQVVDEQIERFDHL